MRRHDAAEQATELQPLATRLLEIRRAEEQLIRDLQARSDSTSRLLEQISEQPPGPADGSS